MRSMPRSTADRVRPPRGWGQELRAEALSALAALRLGFVATLAAWPALLGRMVFYAVCLLVIGAFWRTVGIARLPAALASRLPAGGLVDYVRVTEWITLSVVPVHIAIEEEVRSGAVEARLLRPRSWLVLEGARAIGGTFARLVAVGLMGLLLLALSGEWPAPAGLAQAALLAPGGLFIGIELFLLVGLTAFWLRRVMPAMLICQKLMFLLGGLFAPIALYRGWFHALAAASPFAAHLNDAGEAMIDPSWIGLAGSLASQAVWTLLLGLIIWTTATAALAKLRREGVG